MNDVITALVAAARKLSPEEREELIDEIVAIDCTPADIEAAWLAEVQARITAYERGEVKLYDAEEVLEQLRKR